MIKIEFISNCNNKINEYIIFIVVPGARKHTVNNKPELQQKYGLTGNEIKHVVVVDFGGGTLDVSYCQIRGEKIDVKKNRMNEYLGGNDFDKKMIELIKEKIDETEIEL